VGLGFPGLDRPVVLPDDPALIGALRACVAGWVPETVAVPASGAVDPVCTVERHRGQFRLRSPFLAAPMAGLTVTTAACGVIADLAQGYVEARPGWRALHCGAFALRGRLVAVTGAARAGKSTLIARMTAEPGVAVFCDDVLPLRPDGTAVALGIAPRLRLPLPATLSPTFRAHVARHIGPRDARYGYLCAPGIAPHGTVAPFAAFVVLDRRADGPARLHRLERSEAVWHLLAQTIGEVSPGLDPGAALELADRALDDVVCLRLVYAGLEDAVACLRQAFDAPDWPGVMPADPVPAAAPMAVTAVAPASVWRRADGVAVRRRGDGTFLWRLGGQDLFALDAVAGAIWTLLEAPGSANGLATTLVHVFPDVGFDRLALDAAGLLAQMQAAGLVEPAG
jgi:hypothetical protein